MCVDGGSLFLGFGSFGGLLLVVVGFGGVCGFRWGVCGCVFLRIVVCGGLSFWV